MVRVGCIMGMQWRKVDKSGDKWRDPVDNITFKAIEIKPGLNQDLCKKVEVKGNESVHRGVHTYNRRQRTISNPVQISHTASSGSSRYTWLG